MNKTLKKAAALGLAAAMTASLCSCAVTDTAGALLGVVSSVLSGEPDEVKSIKTAYLSSYSNNITVGDAVESFLAKPKWQYFQTETGEEVVQCTGKCSYDGKEVEAKLQFKLHDDDTFEVYTLSLNDISQNMFVLSAFMEKIYEGAGDKSAPRTERTTADNGNAANNAAPEKINILDTDYYDLDEYYIDEATLNKLSQEQVRILLNAMYAFHGYSFETQKYADYFAGKSWYLPMGVSMDGCEAEFNSYERANKETITAYEKKKGWR